MSFKLEICTFLYNNIIYFYTFFLGLRPFRETFKAVSKVTLHNLNYEDI